MILSLDPSKTATGWVVYDPNQEKLVGYGCFSATMDKKEKAQFSRKTEIYKREQLSFVDFLSELKVKYGIKKIITEYPHGSQSARASWALSMVNSTIATFARLVMGVPAVSYLESDCKKLYFGKSKGVSKKDTMDAMLGDYLSIGYEPREYAGKVVKYEHEAVSDALLVLTTFLKENKD